MFERVLLPLDGSEVSEGIIPYLRQLARAAGSRITILYVAGDGEAGLDGYLREAQRSVSGGELDVETVVLTGKPEERIVEHAENEGFDLIAMSTHGRSGVGRWVFGSTTDKVLHSTTLPLFIVRTPKEKQAKATGPLSSVIVPLDGSYFGESVLNLGADLAEMLKLDLNLIRVVSTTAISMASADPFAMDPSLFGKLTEAAEAYLNKKAEELQGRDIKVRALVEQGYPSRGIVTLAVEAGESLIVMTSRGRSGVGRAVLGSVADKVVRSSPRPVLLINPEDDVVPEE